MAREELKIIDGYEVVRVLGRGGMGVVYKGFEPSLQRNLAIKVLPEHLAENKEFITRFYREARAAASLNHPNVVTIFRVGEDDGRHYIAMEYIQGQEVTDLVKEKGVLPVEEALKITAQVASALQAAHDLGILHRDIKPQNIMLTEKMQVKVMDFGIAKMNEPGGGQNLTMTGQLLGTPAYMSPEQCKGDSSDHRSDIYSLGVAMYQMLAGRVPFSGDTPLAVIRKIVEDDLPAIYSFNQEVPDDVVRILHKTLAKDVEDRYQSAQDLIDDIERFMRGQAVTAPEPGTAGTAGMATGGGGGGDDEDMPTFIGGTQSGGMGTGVQTTQAMQPRKKKSALPLFLFLGLAVLAIGGVLGYKMVLSGDTEVAGVDDPIVDVTPAPTEASIDTIPQVTPEETEAPQPTASPIPNKPPVVEIAFSDDTAFEDESLTVYFKHSDPDEDVLDLAYNLDGKGWKRVPGSDQMQLIGLDAGKHSIQFRARDDMGEDAIAEREFTIKVRPKPQTPKPTPEKTPMRTPVQTPPPTPEMTPVQTPRPANTPRPAMPSGEIGQLRGHAQGVKAVAFSPNGKLALSGGEDMRGIIWDVASQKQLHVLQDHTDWVISVAFSPDGKYALTGGRDAIVNVWDVTNGNKINTFSGHPKTTQGTPNEIMGIGFSGSSTAISASKDGTAATWVITSGSEQGRRNISYGGINAVAFSKDGTKAITVSNDDKKIRVWDMRSGAEKEFDMSAMGRRPKATFALAMSADGRYAVSGGMDKEVRLWDATNGRLIRDFLGHQGWVHAVAFSPDGNTLTSGARDNAVFVWDIQTASSIGEFRQSTDSIYGLDYTPDGSIVISGSADNSVRLFGVPN